MRTEGNTPPRPAPPITPGAGVLMTWWSIGDDVVVLEPPDQPKLELQGEGTAAGMNGAWLESETGAVLLEVAEVEAVEARG